MAEDQEIFTTAQAARFLGCSPATMDVWRSNAKGPPYFYIYRMVRYRRVDVELWAYSGPIRRREIEEIAPCHAERRARVKRPRGRAGAAQRQRRLATEPFCRDCAAEGYQRPADEIDHIVPLAEGGTDSDDNVRSLCRYCHARRTASRTATTHCLENRDVDPTDEKEGG
jgi:5-methylcytosine-specific restriction protein A